MKGSTSANGGAERLLTAAELAQMFRVSHVTVSRWAKSGRIPAEVIVTTLGGQRRFHESWALAQINGGKQ